MSDCARCRVLRFLRSNDYHPATLAQKSKSPAFVAPGLARFEDAVSSSNHGRVEEPFTRKDIPL